MSPLVTPVYTLLAASGSTRPSFMLMVLWSVWSPVGCQGVWSGWRSWFCRQLLPGYEVGHRSHLSCLGRRPLFCLSFSWMLTTHSLMVFSMRKYICLHMKISLFLRALCAACVVQCMASSRCRGDDIRSFILG